MEGSVVLACASSSTTAVSSALPNGIVTPQRIPIGGNTEKWDPPDGPCFHTEREELSLSFQTLQKSLKTIKMVQNRDRKTPAPQRSRLPIHGQPPPPEAEALMEQLVPPPAGWGWEAGARRRSLGGLR